jgi:hypothetical protein
MANRLLSSWAALSDILRIAAQYSPTMSIISAAAEARRNDFRRRLTAVLGEACQ